MATRGSMVLQLRVDRALKQAFTEAAECEKATVAETLRRLMREFVRDSKLREARRQSLLVASAPDAQESMELLYAVQDFDRGC